MRGRPQSAADRHVAGRTLAAIGADHIGTRIRQFAGGLFDGGAHHGAVEFLAAVENHADDDGQTGRFAAAKASFASSRSDIVSMTSPSAPAAARLGLSGEDLRQFLGGRPGP